jgi:hypothetical protein
MHKHYSDFGNNLKINTNINKDSILTILKTTTVFSANRSIHICPKQARNISLGTVPLNHKQGNQHKVRIRMGVAHITRLC